jgi:heterodisulfide reductase subunit B
MDARQAAIKEAFLDFPGLPVVYFTQILAWALGVDRSVLGLAEHRVPADAVFVDTPIAEVRT